MQNLQNAQKDAWSSQAIQQKLADLVDAFTNEAVELWGENVEHPKQVTVHFDTQNKVIVVASEALDNKGRPLLEWRMDAKTGHLERTTRSQDGSNVVTHEKDIDVNNLVPKIEEQVELAKEAEVKQNKPKSFDEQMDLEAQRDLAFKIMYCLIVFIIITFSLLYVFFRMTQINEDQEVAQRKGVKGQRVAGADREQFLDFIAGRMDNKNFVVNPYQQNSACPKTPIDNAHAKAKNIANFNLLSNKSTDKTREGSMNYGFGGNNLDHLSNDERGRFDSIQVDDEQKSDFALLANFSNQKE